MDLFRIVYPVDEAQAKVVKAGLPELLAQRLAAGRKLNFCTYTVGTKKTTRVIAITSTIDACLGSG